MDPDHIALHQVVGYRLREFQVGAFVCLPGIFAKGDFARVIVDQGPHDAIYYTVKTGSMITLLSCCFPNSLANLL